MGEHKNWFARNKGFVFGFAVAVAILNIVIFVLMPQQTPIRIDETVTEYVCGDDSFAAEHTIQLTGTLTRSMLAKPLFLGSSTAYCPSTRTRTSASFSSGSRRTRHSSTSSRPARHPARRR